MVWLVSQAAIRAGIGRFVAPVGSRTQAVASGGLGLAGRHDLLRQAAGQLRQTIMAGGARAGPPRQTIMAVGEGAAPGSRRAQFDDEIADLGLGHVGLDRVPAGPAVTGI